MESDEFENCAGRGRHASAWGAPPAPKRHHDAAVIWLAFAILLAAAAWVIW